MKNVQIAGLGFCGLDTLMLLPHIPIDGKVEILSQLIQGGGPAATAIVTAARLGAQTAFMGVVGDDAKGSQIIEGLRQEGVNINYIQIKKGKESPGACCWIEKESGKRSIAWTKGTSMPMNPLEIKPELISPLKLLHLDGHNTEAAIKAARMAKDLGVLVSLDAGTILPDIDVLVDLADICIASEYFAQKFTGEEDPEKALGKLYQTNCLVAAITSGEQGVIAQSEKGIIRKNAFHVPVVDTTGAGDVFHGAFVFATVQGWSLDVVLEFASATAALKCTKFGGRTGIPTFDEVIHFLKIKNINV